MRVWGATEARAGVVAGVAAACLFVPAICRLNAAPASPSHKAVPCAAADKNAEHDEQGGGESGGGEGEGEGGGGGTCVGMDWRTAAGAKLDVARRNAGANKRPESARKEAARVRARQNQGQSSSAVGGWRRCR